MCKFSQALSKVDNNVSFSDLGPCGCLQYRLQNCIIYQA